MLQPTNLYEEAKRRLGELQSVYSEIEKRLQKAPPGKIHVACSGGRVQFYLRTSPKSVTGTYLSLKKDKSKIKSLLRKQYDEKILKQIKTEIEDLVLFLNKSGDAPGRIQDVYSCNPDKVKQFLNPIDMNSEDYISNWLAMPFEPKAITSSERTLTTDRGEIVRSKSEMNIANALLRHGIPYRYECPLVLKSGVVVHPDFTVLCCKRSREVYWEHRGMMDDRGYAQRAVQRVKDYEKSGIFPGRELILTEETAYCPLDMRDIEMVIQTYFI